MSFWTIKTGALHCFAALSQPRQASRSKCPPSAGLDVAACPRRLPPSTTALFAPLPCVGTRHRPAYLVLFPLSPHLNSPVAVTVPSVRHHLLPSPCFATHQRAVQSIQARATASFK